MRNLAALLLFLASLFCTLENSYAEERKYRIGLIIPLSGPVATLGDYVKKGVILAHERLPAQIKDSIELIIEDDGFDPKRTIAAYHHISAKAPLDASFVIASPPSHALAPITEKKKEILFAIGASDPNIVKDRPYTFIHWVIPPVLGTKLGDELVRRNFKRVAFITAEGTGTLADTNAAIDQLKKLEVSDRIAYNQTFEPTVTDYRSPIASLKSKKVDAAVLVLFPGALSSFAKQARQLNLKAELIGMESFEDDNEVKAADGALNDTWFVTASDPTDEFAKIYKERWGTHPGWASANAYDSMTMLAHIAVENKFNSSAVKDALGKVQNYNGAAGTYSASGDNRFNLPATLKRVTKDGFVRIDKSDAK